MIRNVFLSAEQFLYDRNRGHALSSFMTQTSVPEEDEGADEDEEYDPMNDSRNYQRPALSDVDEGMLDSVRHMQNAKRSKFCLKGDVHSTDSHCISA